MSKRKATGARRGGALMFEDEEYYTGMEKIIPWDRWFTFVSARLIKEGFCLTDDEKYVMIRLYLLKELNSVPDAQLGRLEAELKRSPVLRKFANLTDEKSFPAKEEFKSFLNFMATTGTGQVLCSDLIDILDNLV